MTDDIYDDRGRDILERFDAWCGEPEGDATELMHDMAHMIDALTKDAIRAHYGPTVKEIELREGVAGRLKEPEIGDPIFPEIAARLNQS